MKKVATLRSQHDVIFGHVYLTEQGKYLAVQKGCTYGYLAGSIKEAAEIFSNKVYTVIAKRMAGFSKTL